MTFLAPVFGQVISDGGLILLQNSLGWGSVNNPGGHIQSSGRCFNATLQAPGGVVQLASAENCLVIGRKVIIHEAVKCQIFAHSVQLGTAAACMIAGRDISIQASKAYKHEPSVITMVVPELSALDREIETLESSMAEMRTAVDGLGARIQAFKANADLANYLSIRTKLRAGMLTLSDEQNQVFLKMGERLGDATTALETAVAERNPIVKVKSCWKLFGIPCLENALQNSKEAKIPCAGKNFCKSLSDDIGAKHIFQTFDRLVDVSENKVFTIIDGGIDCHATTDIFKKVAVYCFVV